MQNYIRLQQEVLLTGSHCEDRTGTGTTRKFAVHRDLKFDLRERFPAPTTKALAQKACFGELLWFINGCNTIGELKHYTFGDFNDPRRTIWCANYEKQGKELGYTDGYCGEVYGYNWRNFGGKVDQLQKVIDTIKTNPTDRRLVVYTVNPAAENTPILPPCHDFFQFFVEDGYIDIDFHMRSTDVFLGLPFNIASYAALLQIVATICGLTARYVSCALGDTHIYHDHLEAVAEQLCRTPTNQDTRLILPGITSLEDLKHMTADDIRLVGYNPQPSIQAPMSA
jgi:thymidylate synthase